MITRTVTAHARSVTETDLAPTAGADIVDVNVGDVKAEGWGSGK